MGSNFTIYRHRTNKRIRLQLSGDFDGSSAWELLNEIHRDLDLHPKVVVDTQGLKHIEPFGVAVFHANLSMKRHAGDRIRFIGDKAQGLAQM